MNKHKTIKVVSVPTGKQVFIEEISIGLKSLQAEVGGYIQAIYPFEDEVALICNDEAIEVITRLLSSHPRRVFTVTGVLTAFTTARVISSIFGISFRSPAPALYPPLS